MLTPAAATPVLMVYLFWLLMPFYYNWNGGKYCKIIQEHLEQQLIGAGGTVNVTVTAVTLMKRRT
jgi:hypothetical protein